MPLKKKIDGSNMYEWVSHLHSHLGGECSHKCSYCYVNNPRHGRPERYTGEIRLIEDEFSVQYSEKVLTRMGKYPATIFIEHMNDLFAEEVTDTMILRILSHCNMYPDNTYVLQTKNPIRYYDWLRHLPKNVILGTTIESNRWIPEVMGNAPKPVDRYLAMKNGIPKTIRRFLTLEPICDFDVPELAMWIAEIKPDFLNLGADSKDKGLPEPTVEKVMALVAALHELGVELREKHNLQRLKSK